MKYFAVIFFVGLAYAYPQPQQQAEVTTVKYPAYVCLSNGTLVPPPEIVEKVAICNDPSKYWASEGKTASHLKHPKCATFCLTEAIGCLDKDGFPSEGCHEAYVKREFPENQVDTILTKLRECYDKYHNFAQDDGQCNQVNGFIECAFNIYSHLSC